MGIADARGKSVEAVALRWMAQNGYAISNRITADYHAVSLAAKAFCSDGNCKTALTEMADTYSEPHRRGELDHQRAQVHRLRADADVLLVDRMRGRLLDAHLPGADRVRDRQLCVHLVLSVICMASEIERARFFSRLEVYESA